MNNVLAINGRKAVIQFDPDIGLFRGEFTGLSDGADFHAADVEGLKRECAISLRVYLDDCKAKGRKSSAHASGTFTLRLPPEDHAAAKLAAKAAGASLNECATIVREATRQ